MQQEKIGLSMRLIIAAAGLCILLFLVKFYCSTLIPSIHLHSVVHIEPYCLTNEEKLDLILGPADGSAAGSVTDDASRRMNINSASAEELTSLPGIGKTLAERIVRYRVYNGNFRRSEDIMKVSGISEKTYDRIKDMITVLPDV